MKRVATGFRLTEKAKQLIEQISEETGMSYTSVVEQAVRHYARQALLPDRLTEPRAEYRAKD